MSSDPTVQCHRRITIRQPAPCRHSTACHHCGCGSWLQGSLAVSRSTLYGTCVLRCHSTTYTSSTLTVHHLMRIHNGARSITYTCLKQSQSFHVLFHLFHPVWLHPANQSPRNAESVVVAFHLSPKGPPFSSSLPTIQTILELARS